jgi:hypothetical protein
MLTNLKSRVADTILMRVAQARIKRGGAVIDWHETKITLIAYALQFSQVPFDKI